MRNPKFQIFKGSTGRTYFRLRAGNGQIILSSEAYESESAAKNGIASVKKNAANDSRFQRKSSSKGQPYFVLVAGNNEPIGKSEMYSSNSAMENGIKAVMRVAAKAPTEDLTN